MNDNNDFKKYFGVLNEAENLNNKDLNTKVKYGLNDEFKNGVPASKANRKAYIGEAYGYTFHDTINPEEAQMSDGRTARTVQKESLKTFFKKVAKYTATLALGLGLITGIAYTHKSFIDASALSTRNAITTAEQATHGMLAGTYDESEIIFGDGAKLPKDIVTYYTEKCENEEVATKELNSYLKAMEEQMNKEDIKQVIIDQDDYCLDNFDTPNGKIQLGVKGVCVEGEYDKLYSMENHLFKDKDGNIKILTPDKGLVFGEIVLYGEEVGGKPKTAMLNEENLVKYRNDIKKIRETSNDIFEQTDMNYVTIDDSKVDSGKLNSIDDLVQHSAYLNENLTVISDDFENNIVRYSGPMNGQVISRLKAMLDNGAPFATAFEWNYNTLNNGEQNMDTPTGRVYVVRDEKDIENLMNTVVDRSIISLERSKEIQDRFDELAHDLVDAPDSLDIEGASARLTPIVSYYKDSIVSVELLNGDVLTIDTTKGEFYGVGETSYGRFSDAPRTGSFYINGEKVSFTEASKCVRDELNTRTAQLKQPSLDDMIK